MKQFAFAGKEKPESAIDGAEPVEFGVLRKGGTEGNDDDYDVFTAYPPTPGQMAVVMQTQASGSVTTQIAGVIDFLDIMLDDAAQARFRERLMDRDDPLDLEQVQEISSSLLEEWSSVPTESSSASSA